MRLDESYNTALGIALRDSARSPDSRGSVSPHSTSSSSESPGPESYTSHHSPINNVHEGTAKSVEMLCRIFPHMKRHVLQLILHGCNGDVVQAIDQIFNSQTEGAENRTKETLDSVTFVSPYIPNSFDSSVKSAFTPRSISGLNVASNMNPLRYAWGGLPPPGLFSMPYQSMVSNLAPGYHSAYSGLPQVSSKPVMYSSYPFSHFTQDRPSDFQEKR